jgi:multidrug efflux pump subunit AcrA (membrane-fusion protein)
LQGAPHALAPLAALRKDGARDVVYVVDAGKVVAQPVKLGLRNEDQGLVEVTDGLAAGALLVAAKLDGVKPGSKVKVAPAAAAPAAKG